MAWTKVRRSIAMALKRPSDTFTAIVPADALGSRCNWLKDNVSSIRARLRCYV